MNFDISRDFLPKDCDEINVQKAQIYILLSSRPENVLIGGQEARLCEALRGVEEIRSGVAQVHLLGSQGAHWKISFHVFYGSTHLLGDSIAGRYREQALG